MTFIFYLVFVPSIASVMMKILYVTSGGMHIYGGIERMDYVLHQRIMPETDNPRTCEGSDVEFINVSFSYNQNSDTEALSNLSFNARQGEITAVVVLPAGEKHHRSSHTRFFDVEEGSIRIGGVDIKI